MSQLLAACLTRGLGSSRKSSIRNSPTLLNSANSCFESRSLYLWAVSLQKWAKRWMEAYLSGAEWVLKDLLTVSTNS